MKLPQTANPPARPRPEPLWTELAGGFLRIGTTVWGGMWGGVRELEREFVRRRRWLSSEQLRLWLVLSTLMPAPRFIGLAGLVGFQLRGWWGSVVAVLSLLLPSSLMVLAAVIAASHRMVPVALETVQRWISVAVVGVLLGNAWRHAWESSIPRQRRVVGVLLGAGVAVSVHHGAPLVLAAAGGLLVGWWLLERGGQR